MDLDPSVEFEVRRENGTVVYAALPDKKTAIEARDHYNEADGHWPVAQVTELGGRFRCYKATTTYEIVE